MNALAGGGTLITFPTLIALGVPPVAANVTNTVALCPGYLGGTLAQRGDLAGQGRRLAIFIPAGIAGGLLGGFLLLRSGERLFGELVPYLILGAAALLAMQERLRAVLARRRRGVETSRGGESGSAIAGVGVHRGSGVAGTAIAVGGILAASVYGGYFGAGLSVILLAVLGLVMHDSLTRLNALKQAIALVVNVAAAILFIRSGPVVWPVTLVMSAGALLGGAAGGRLASRVKPATLRRAVVTIGLAAGIIYLVR